MPTFLNMTRLINEFDEGSVSVSVVSQALRYVKGLTESVIYEKKHSHWP